MDRSRYDSAMFWLPFGTAAAVIGLALMTIGITRLAPYADVFGSVWFDTGLGLLTVGALLLLWALWLFLGRRRDAARSAEAPSAPSSGSKRPNDMDVNEAVRGYYKERDNLFRMWQREQREKRKRR